jgi:ferrochelatase
VPVAFTSDHIETLSEVDIEYAELAHSLGLEGFKRAPSLNDSPIFLDALADLVNTHLVTGEQHHARYRERCPGCRNPSCRTMPTAVVEQAAVRAVA